MVSVLDGREKQTNKQNGTVYERFFGVFGRVPIVRRGKYIWFAFDWPTLLANNQMDKWKGIISIYPTSISMA
jgi:hypothetical protein